MSAADAAATILGLSAVNVDINDDDAAAASDDAAAPDDPDDVACPPLFPPKHGYLECSRPLPEHRHAAAAAGSAEVPADAGDGDGGGSTSGAAPAIVVHHEPNRPGSQCVLRCPTGFTEAGRFEKICDFNGRWIGEEGGSCISEYIRAQRL